MDFSNLQGLSVWNHVFEDKETPSNLIQNSRKHGLRCATTFQFKLRPKTLKKVRQNSPKKKLHFFDFFFILCRGYSRTGFARDSNGHFQNYQKWSRFHGNYQNRRTSIFWLMVLSTKIDSTCVQMFGVGWGTNADGCRWHDWGADVSNAEESCYQESFLLLFFYDPTTSWPCKQPKFKIWLVQRFLSFFLSWVMKTQPNHWTKRMAEYPISQKVQNLCTSQNMAGTRFRKCTIFFFPGQIQRETGSMEGEATVNKNRCSSEWTLEAPTRLLCRASRSTAVVVLALSSIHCLLFTL